MTKQTNLLINGFKSFNPFILPPTPLQELLEKTIEPSLHAQTTVERILPNNPFFARAENLRKKYQLPEKGFENFQRLLCGIRDFPCILLQNPKNDELEFEEMITETDSLHWLQEVLNDIGFTLDDIIIMDLFPMLTDTWLEEHPDERAQAVQDMFNLTLDFIHEFKLPIILACQCFKPSGKKFWASFRDTKVCDLRSSMQGTRNQNVSQFNQMEHTAHVVHGFHPAYLSYVYDERYRESCDRILRTTFCSLFDPYAKYLKRYSASLLEKGHIKRSIQALRGLAIKFDHIREPGLSLDLFQYQDNTNILDDWNDLKSILDPILNKLSPTTPASLRL